MSYADEVDEPAMTLSDDARAAKFARAAEGVPFVDDEELKRLQTATVTQPEYNAVQAQATRAWQLSSDKLREVHYIRMFVERDERITELRALKERVKQLEKVERENRANTAERMLVQTALRWDAADRNDHWANGHDREYAARALKEMTGELRSAIALVIEVRSLQAQIAALESTNG